ncbi:hypothetical protein KSD_07630 [Ktedonobacter sp. SOSP1-85]|uniref:hypothetical protein n=1 Tax=Ktedonobacter sp. SOSP1-85 TaxID=2778367 RepID=UPI001915892F|nr:hypothetical protein [Ktedonobacter sp. SOSP1-85]GHO72992.1 hypothetical protein KSD_07630 [Ktedonobacter sp. SOSP1-85]
MVVNQSYLSKGIQWFEERLVELSYLFLIVGFCLGTIDLFTQGTLMSNGLMVYIWATTQAIAIDGSLLVKWKRFALALYTKSWGAALAYLPICILFSVVAWAVNDIQSMAEVLKITPIESVQRLGLDLPTLTHIRGALVVLVAISIAVENAISKAVEDKKVQTKSSELVPNQGTRSVQIAVEELDPMELEGAKDVALLGTSKDQGTSQKDQGPNAEVQGSKEQGTSGLDDLVPGAKVQSSEVQGDKQRRAPLTPEALKVYDAYTALIAKGLKPTASLLQVEAAVSLGTAKKYLREIRQKEAV